MSYTIQMESKNDAETARHLRFTHGSLPTELVDASFVRKLVFPQLLPKSPNGSGVPILPSVTGGMPLAPNRKYIVEPPLRGNPFTVKDGNWANVGLLFSKIVQRCKSLDELHIP